MMSCWNPVRVEEADNKENCSSCRQLGKCPRHFLLLFFYSMPPFFVWATICPAQVKLWRKSLVNFFLTIPFLVSLPRMILSVPSHWVVFCSRCPYSVSGLLRSNPILWSGLEISSGVIRNYAGLERELSSSGF